MQVSCSMLLQNGDVIIAVEMYVSLIVLSTFPVIFVYAFYRKDFTDSCHYTMVMNVATAPKLQKQAICH